MYNPARCLFSVFLLTVVPGVARARETGVLGGERTFDPQVRRLGSGPRTFDLSGTRENEGASQCHASH